MQHPIVPLLSTLLAVLALSGTLVVAAGSAGAAGDPGATGDRQACAQTTAEPQAAIAACTRLMGDPEVTDRAFLLLRRGDAYRRLADLARAVEDYSAALRLEPSLAAARVNRGLALRRLGRLDAALADYDAVLAIEPGHRAALNNRATVRVARGEHAAAIADLSRLIAADAEATQAYFNRAVARMATGDAGGALADIDALLARSPKDGEALVVRSKALAALARGQGAAASTTAGPSVSARTDLPVVTLRAERTGQSRAPAETAATAEPPARNQGPEAAPAAPSPPAAQSPPPTAMPSAGPRVALVIGNSRYESVTTLVNPQRDATAMARALSAIGFSVDGPHLDQDRTAMLARLKAFSAKAEKAAVALFFFAGHGIELEGANYLIPTDARLTRSQDAEFEAIPLPLVLTTVERADRLGLVILDACRDDPFRATLRSAGATRGLARGLAQIEPRRGTLVAYAAKHGTAAYDGDGTNSPFTGALLRHLATPGLDISLLFRKVGDEVWQASGGQQLPFVYGSLPGEVVALVP